MIAAESSLSHPTTRVLAMPSVALTSRFPMLSIKQKIRILILLEFLYHNVLVLENICWIAFIGTLFWCCCCCTAHESVTFTAGIGMDCTNYPSLQVHLVKYRNYFCPCRKVHLAYARELELHSFLTVSFHFFVSSFRLQQILPSEEDKRRCPDTLVEIGNTVRYIFIL
jgi:hypothetical protein